MTKDKVIKEIENALDIADKQAEMASERLTHSQVFSELRKVVDEKQDC